jgi:hypothetical protein
MVATNWREQLVHRCVNLSTHLLAFFGFIGAYVVLKLSSFLFAADDEAARRLWY